MRQDTLDFLRCVERATVRCHTEVPTPLCLTNQRQHIFHLLFRSSLIPSKFSFDMGFGKFLLQAVTDFIGLALAFVDVVAQSFLTFAVAGLAGTVYHSQRTLYMVVAELHATFTLIRHVAVRTRYATLTVNAHPGYFKIGVLRFQDRGTAQLVYIVVETSLIIIGFHVFHRKTFVPGESQVLAVALEVILHMALRTYQ